jgi:hypothetical protein
MNEENEFYYDSDEDFYEDFDDDEFDVTDINNFTEADIDTLIHTIRMYGSKYRYFEIEKLIQETNKELVFQWFQVFELVRDPSGSKKQTFDKIEELLDAKCLQLKNTTPTATPPFHHETVGTSTPSHDEVPKAIPINKNIKQNQDHFFNSTVSHIKQADLVKNLNIFTKELKTAFTKAAFQQ